MCSLIQTIFLSLGSISFFFIKLLIKFINDSKWVDVGRKFFSKDEKKENGIDSATQRFDYSEREVIHVIPSKDQKESHKVYLDKLSKASNKKLNW